MTKQKIEAMKKVVKFFGLAATGLFAAVNVSAQGGFVQNLGDNPAQCQRNLQIYQTDYQMQMRQTPQQRNFDEVIVYWRRLWAECPLSSPNLTTQGAIIYKHYIDRELNHARRAALVDTLMQIWERSIILRPERATDFQTLMMADMLRYADTPENEGKILDLLRNIMATQGERTTAATYAQYMTRRFTQNREGRLSDEDLLDEYNTISDALTDVINNLNDEDLARVRDMIDNLFINSNAASRENLLRIYSARYDENLDNEVWLRRLTRLLTQREYTDTELYANAAERLYALNPTPAAAYSMAMLFMERGNIERAIEYFEEAIRNEVNPVDRA